MAAKQKHKKKKPEPEEQITAELDAVDSGGSIKDPAF